ncbi:MAG: OmpA family protein [Chitinophagaceae bacterium]|nr:MAG: OmpA family protein [Chitinophagaceae bacterium]
MIYHISFLLFLFLCINLNAQNLVINPDFSDILIFYSNGKKVYPNHWSSYSWPFPPFSHPARAAHGEFPTKPVFNEKKPGVILLHVLQPSEGITTKLKENLVPDQKYEVKVKVKIFKAKLSSDYYPEDTKVRVTREGDTVDLGYNKVVSLIVKFHYTLPACPPDLTDTLLFLDFDEEITPDYPYWITLSTTYIARGGESYFSIGSCSTSEYIGFLQKHRSDTINYNNKFTRYLISYVSILPVYDDEVTDIKFLHSFDPDSIYPERIKKFIIRNIFFDFDKYELSDLTKRELSELSIYLLENPNITLNIIGHTDSIGSADYNQVLSENRAKSVYSYLISKGIDDSRLNWKGRGMNDPLEGENYLKNFEMHRRVEFEMLLNNK